MRTVFNRNEPVIGKSIAEPSADTIEQTLNLRQVSLEDAVRYGGPITRNALGAMNFRGDRKYIVVDTKVHFLMKGFIPAIPGWHTDGVPRGDDLNPGGKGAPRIDAQIEGSVTAPRYHLLVTGTHCPTRFVRSMMYMDVENSRDLYKNMSRDVNERIAKYKEGRSHADLSTLDEWLFIDTPPSTVVEWDWWNIHTAQEATATGWRYLIRVTETDHIAPRTNPADFIRTQTQVYVPTEFGW